MELGQLRTFVTLARTLHFTRAAEELGLSQPAVSHQIKSLENETGARLFDRGSTKSISLTTHGKKILEYADVLLQRVDKLKLAIDDSKSKEHGELVVSTSLSSVSNPFLTIRKGFLKLYPGITIYLNSAKDQRQLTDQIKSGECQIGVAGSAEHTEGLLAIPYGSAEMVPCVGISHRLAGVTDELKFNELVDEAWVLLAEGSELRERIDAMFERNDFKPNTVQDLNDPDLVRDIIEIGNGIGFLPSWSLTPHSKTLTPLNLEDKIKLSLYLLIPENTTDQLVLRHLEYVLQEQLEGIELEKDLRK